jgi:hypothetical protein
MLRLNESGTSRETSRILTIGIGRLFLPMSTTLIVQGVIAPLACAALTWRLFERHSHLTPLTVAVAFLHWSSVPTRWWSLRCSSTVPRCSAVLAVRTPALFCFAFLPQLVRPTAGRVPRQMLSLSLLFVGLSAMTDCGWAMAAGHGGQLDQAAPRFTAAQPYATGSALIGLGAAAALTGRGRK